MLITIWPVTAAPGLTELLDEEVRCCHGGRGLGGGDLVGGDPGISTVGDDGSVSRSGSVSWAGGDNGAEDSDAEVLLPAPGGRLRGGLGGNGGGILGEVGEVTRSLATYD